MLKLPPIEKAAGLAESHHGRPSGRGRAAEARGVGSTGARSVRIAETDPGMSWQVAVVAPGSLSRSLHQGNTMVFAGRRDGDDETRSGPVAAARCARALKSQKGRARVDDAAVSGSARR